MGLASRIGRHRGKRADTTIEKSSSKTVDSKGAFQYFPDSILRNPASSVGFRGIRNTVGISSVVFELGGYRLERFDLFQRRRAYEVKDGPLVIDRQRGSIVSLSRNS